MAAVSDEGFEIKRLGEHRNAFGFLRLFFASLVIVSHTPELVDGDRHREPLEMATGIMSLGDLAVDGFFIISGYLIVGSYLKRPEIIDYFLRRVARIFPAFIVASLLCVLIVAPIAGASLTDLRASAGFSLVRPLLLQEPWVANTFADNANTQLNGPMWTIAYEFRCYLLVIVLGLCGALRSWRFVLGLAVMLLGLSALTPQAAFDWFDGLTPFSEELIGDAQPGLRLTGMFLMGAVFFLKRGEIELSPKFAGIAAVLLVACFAIPGTRCARYCILRSLSDLHDCCPWPDGTAEPHQQYQRYLLWRISLRLAGRATAVAVLPNHAAGSAGSDYLCHCHHLRLAEPARDRKTSNAAAGVTHPRRLASCLTA